MLFTERWWCAFSEVVVLFIEGWCFSPRGGGAHLARWCFVESSNFLRRGGAAYSTTLM